VSYVVMPKDSSSALSGKNKVSPATSPRPYGVQTHTPTPAPSALRPQCPRG